MTCPVPPPSEGRIAIVTDVGSGMRWTWRRAGRSATMRTAKSRGPVPPTLGSSLAKTFRKVTVANKPGHRGEREVSRKPSRRESRACSGSPVVLPPCFFIARGPRVRSAPGFPCALWTSRAMVAARLGQIMPRECRLSSSRGSVGDGLSAVARTKAEAIQILSAEAFRIAWLATGLFEIWIRSKWLACDDGRMIARG